MAKCKFFLISSLCCLCSIQIEANPAGMCNACAKTQVDIADGIIKHATIFYCKGCDRYQKPPWMHFPIESSDFMSFLLSKIKGLKTVKLIDSNFIWTEPHSKKKKIKITVQKEYNNTLLQTSLIIEFTEEWTQCEECKKTFTPHIWTASCQVRQKVHHKRTFLYLEQAVLKHKMHEKALNVKEEPEGVDFYFKNRSHANAFADFVHSILPCKVKDSKRLISHDQWSNLYNYKYSYMIEVAPVCKDDLIVLTSEQKKEFGGIGPVLLCYKISTNVHLVDPLTFEVIEFDENTYWKHNFRSHIDRSTLKEYVIQNIEEEVDYKEKFSNQSFSVTATEDIDMTGSKVNTSKSTNYKITKKIQNENVNKKYFSRRENHKFKIVKVDCVQLGHTKDGEHKLYSFRCHLGDKIKTGDTVYGYDVEGINSTVLEHEDEVNSFPEVVLVKKKYDRTFRRFWKLQRMKMADKDIMDEDIGEYQDEEKKKKKKKKEINNKTGNMQENYEDFLRDIEEDKDLRKNINIYKDDDALKELTEKFNKLEVDDILKKNDEDFGIGVEELMSNLKITGQAEEEIANTKKPTPSTKEFLEPLPVNQDKKKIKLLNRKKENEENTIKSQLNQKRDRKGSDIISSSNDEK